MTADTAPAGGARVSARLLAVLAAVALAIAAGGYAYTGSPALLLAAPPAAAPLDPAMANAARTLDAMFEQLAARLAAKPDDGAGWALMARSAAAMGRNTEALAAFAKAHALLGEQPDLLADHADALATQQRSLAGEPTRLLDRALAVAPDHLKARLLAGTAAFERGDHAAAVGHWQRVDASALGDTALAAQLQERLSEARRRARLPALAAAKPAPSIAASANASISGTVTLAPALAAGVRPDDTVFVYARAVGGTRQPLAVVRAQVRDLPLRFVLDDRSAMSPQWRLSQATQVVVDARVSRSGDAMPRAGDAVGRSAPVAPGTEDLRIEIADTLPSADR
jgi:cytochrome c-type biogenesis protein CcmH